jgi:hemin uptake protein HemP
MSLNQLLRPPENITVSENGTQEYALRIFSDSTTRDHGSN